MFASILFFIFSFLILASALLVITSKNPVNSVIFLIFSFFNAAGIFLIAGAEFLALIMLIVYVGAVAVLFLFVVMMLDLNFEELNKKTNFVKTGIITAGILIAEMIVLFVYYPEEQSFIINKNNELNNLTNTEIIGSKIYTEHFYHFQIAGLILLVAMIGAIVLTLRHRDNVRRQDISSQVSRDQEKNVELKDITFEESE
jgi:NADH:ubiquinone oxidoreductase subunit 6 (chain J)